MKKNAYKPRPSGPSKKSKSNPKAKGGSRRRRED